MVDSYVFSATFIIVESGFVMLSLIAAYELFKGDFIWIQEEEERRSAKHSQRGRGIVNQVMSSGGYASLGQRQISQHTRHEYHRSLSPGRGGSQRGFVGNDDETSSLLHTSRGKISRDSTALSEENYYHSPVDTRSVDIGRERSERGSTGDRTRRLFYKLILVSLIARVLLIPLETICSSRIHNNKDENESLLRLLFRLSQTLPEIILASSLGLMVTFCAQIAFSALPPLSPKESEEGIDDDDNTEGTPNFASSADLVGKSQVNEEGFVESKKMNGENRNENNCTVVIGMSMSQIARKIFASKQTFTVWNIILFISYTAPVSFFTFRNESISVSESYLWILLTTVYSFLLLSLVYVGSMLEKALRPSIERRKDTNTLAVRLLYTCAVLAWMFLERSIYFGIAACDAFLYDDEDRQRRREQHSYRIDALQYLVSDLLPVLFLLVVMHRKRRIAVDSDVYMIHTFMNNLLESMGRLGQSEVDDTAATLSSPFSDGAPVNAAVISELGTRRIQTYGNTLAGRTIGGIKRVESSNGGKGVGTLQHKQ